MRKQVAVNKASESKSLYVKKCIVYHNAGLGVCLNLLRLDVPYIMKPKCLIACIKLMLICGNTFVLAYQSRHVLCDEQMSICSPQL